MRKILRKEGLKKTDEKSNPQTCPPTKGRWPNQLGTVQALLGHSTSEITRKVYLHAIPEDQQFRKINDGQWQELSLLFLVSIGRAPGASGERGASDLCVERHVRGEEAWYSQDHLHGPTPLRQCRERADGGSRDRCHRVRLRGQ